jgi:hypothetical protein
MKRDKRKAAPGVIRREKRDKRKTPHFDEILNKTKPRPI